MGKTESTEIRQYLFELDDALFKLSCSVDLVGVLHEALNARDYDEETYANAALAIYRGLCGQLSEVCGIVEREIKAMKKAGEETE